MSTAHPPPNPDRTDSAHHPRRSNRRWVVALLTLVVFLLILVADRLAATVAERKLAARIQTTQQLASRPHVTIEGFPFLLQAITGAYRHVDITSTSPIARDGVTISRAQAHLNSVHVRLSDVLHGTVRDVPVRTGTGSALVTYSALTALVHRYGGAAGAIITVTAGGRGRARLTGPFGLSLEVSGVIIDGAVRITPDAAALTALPSLLRSAISKAVATPIPLPALPFGVTLTSGAFAPTGLILHAAARNSAFPVR